MNQVWLDLIRVIAWWTQRSLDSVRGADAGIKPGASAPGSENKMGSEPPKRAIAGALDVILTISADTRSGVCRESRRDAMFMDTSSPLCSGAHLWVKDD